MKETVNIKITFEIKDKEAINYYEDIEARKEFVQLIKESVIEGFTDESKYMTNVKVETCFEDKDKIIKAILKQLNTLNKEQDDGVNFARKFYTLKRACEKISLFINDVNQEQTNNIINLGQICECFLRQAEK